MPRQADASASQPTGILAGNVARKTNKKQAKAPLHPDHECESCKSAKEDKWADCVHDVQKKGKGYNAFAVCTTSVGTRQVKKEVARVFEFKSRIREKATNAGGESRYRVTIIEEGLGNFKDAFFYTKEALQSGVEQFEGRKCYFNHPSLIDEEVRPERDVREIAGNFENCAFVEDAQGRGRLDADLVVPAGRPYDMARAMCDHALAFREKNTTREFVGLSINASGDATEADIDDVMASAPAPCLPKLEEAKEKGIEKVQVCSEIQDAVSVDLVTEAGAGGKILKLLEQERKNMGKKKVTKRAESKNGKVASKGRVRESEHEDEDEDGDGGDEDHADADQDKALIAQMIKKHLGDGDDVDESEHETIGETYQMYQDMGMDEDEAMEAALKHHQVEKKKAEKKEAGKGDQPSPDALQAESADGDDGSDDDSDDGADDDDKDGDDGDDDSGSSEEKKERNAKLKLAGRVAFLERELATTKLEKHIDRKLSESKLPRKATKLFIEKAGKFRDIKDFNTKFAIFVEAYNAERSESFEFVTMTEKVSRGNETELQSFADCVQED